MRKPMRLLIVLAALAAAPFAGTGCETHENFPVALDVTPVPTPANFVITQPDPQAYDYDFTWDIVDPGAIVDRYRIYLVGGDFSPDELLGESQTNSFLATFPFSVSGVRFAVSAVSTENVEGARDESIAP